MNGGDVEAWRIRRTMHEGEWYTPVVRNDGVIATPELVEAFAHTPDVHRAGVATVRRFHAVLIDELPLRGDNVGARYVIAGARWAREGVPLDLGDSGLQIGTVERIERTTSPAGVAQLEGDARLYDSAAGTLAWRAIAAGVYTGVCCVWIHYELEGERGKPELVKGGRLAYVKLGHESGNCCAAAKITRTWEAP